MKEKIHSGYSISVINSIDKNADKCTWICHDNTRFCKENHVKYLHPFYKYTDTAYFGIINLLQKMGNYRLANVIILIILVPLFIWFFIIKSLNMQDEIRKLERKQ